MPTATLTRDDQRTAALKRANDIRTARAHLKKDLTAGRIAAEDVLSDIPDYCQTMRLQEFLVSLKRIGHVKAGSIIRDIGAAPTRRLRDLTARQRGLLILSLGRRGC